MSIERNVVLRYRLGAQRIEFNVNTVKSFKQDLKVLLSNVKRIKSYRDYLKLFEGMRVWKSHYHTTIYERLIPTLKERDDRDDVYWAGQLQKACWGLYVEALEPFRVPGKYWSETRVLQSFLEDSPKWINRFKRSAKGAFDRLSDFCQWSVDRSKSIVIPNPETLQVDIAGFPVKVVGEPKYLRMDLQEIMERLRQALRGIAQISLIKRYPIPIVVDLTQQHCSLLGRYCGDRIELYDNMWRQDPKRMEQTIVHEFGHHIWGKYLSSGDQEYWSTCLVSDRTDLDINALMGYWDEFKATSLLDLLEKIRPLDTLLAIQISAVVNGWVEGSGQDIDRPSWEQLRANGAHIRVHGTPITPYAHKNAEEAFCEAFSMQMVYGGRAVHPLIKSWLRQILGQNTIKSAFKEVDLGSKIVT